MRKDKTLQSDVLLTGLVVTLTCCAAPAEDWPQAAANPARTAHVPDEPRGGYKLLWVKRLNQEIITNTNQPIIVGGVIYIGTNNGIIHALEAETGNEVWTADAGGPIVHALASDGGLVFAAVFDGSMRAFARETGRSAWTTKVSRRGFSAAPLLMGGNLYVGNRDGVFYALDAKTGGQLWKRDTGDPIVQTAAGAEGKIVFVNEGMKAFCLEAASGKVLWQTGPLPGRSVRDYWPLIYKGKVVIRTVVAGPRNLTGNMVALQQRLFWPIVWGPPPANSKIIFRANTVDDVIKERDIFVRFFEEFPEIRTFIVLNLADGEEPYTASVGPACRNVGPPTPPVLAGDGRLYTPFRTSAANRGVCDITHCALGHFDIETGLIAKPILCGFAEVSTRLKIPRTPFEMTSDETVTMSSGGKLIFGFRAGHSGGVINVETQKTFRLPQVELPRSSGNLQRPGNFIAISGKYVVHTKFSHVICIKGK